MDFLHNQTNALRDMLKQRELGDLPGFRGDVLGDLTGVGAVVHKQEFNVFFVSDEKLSESRSEHVSGLLGLLAANLWLSDLASEASPHSRVNTSLLSPRSLNQCEHDVS